MRRLRVFSVTSLIICYCILTVYILSTVFLGYDNYTGEHISLSPGVARYRALQTLVTMNDLRWQEFFVRSQYTYYVSVRMIDYHASNRSTTETSFVSTKSIECNFPLELNDRSKLRANSFNCERTCSRSVVQDMFHAWVKYL